jgi:hypothetical protein
MGEPTARVVEAGGPATLRRVFVVAWIAVGLAGALNHTIAERLLGRRFDLALPQLKAGYIMFNVNPRTAKTYEYAGADGVRHDLSDLVATPSPGYARARLFINATLDPAFLGEVCLRATHAFDEAGRRPSLASSARTEYDFFVTEYRVDVDPRSPTQSTTLHCDAHGLRAR